MKPWCSVRAGEELARYAKLHPFSFGGRNEALCRGCTPGGVSLAGLQGSAVCLLRPAISRGFSPGDAARGGTPAGHCQLAAARQAHWLALLVARAIENQAYVVGVNRVGSDPHAPYGGASLIVGPRGEILAQGSAAAEVLSPGSIGRHCWNIGSSFRHWPTSATICWANDPHGESGFRRALFSAPWGLSTLITVGLIPRDTMRLLRAPTLRRAANLGGPNRTRIRPTHRLRKSGHEEHCLVRADCWFLVAGRWRVPLRPSRPTRATKT